MIRPINAGEGDVIALIDYDWTLADTTRSSNDLWTMISNISGIAVERVAKDGEGFHPSHLGGYDYAAHVRSYGLDEAAMWGELDELARTGAEQNPPAYIYDDSAPFMKELINSGQDPTILTFGVEPFQLGKIKPNLAHLTGIQDCDDGRLQIPVTAALEPKGLYIARAFPGRRGFLVDDKPNQQLPLGFAEIHLDRTRPEDHIEQTETGFVVGSLMQALNAIKSLNHL